MKAKPAAAAKKSEPCASTASDGTLKCALAAVDALGRTHAVHTTLRRGAKAPMHVTWSVADDGRVKVIEYVKGKRTAERFEGEAVEHTKLCPRCGGNQCEPGDCLYAMRPGSLADKCTKCGLEMGEHDGKKCPKPKKNVLGIGEFPIAPVTADDPRLTVARDEDDESDDPLDDEVRSDADRDLARQMREDREAHASELKHDESVDNGRIVIEPPDGQTYELGYEVGETVPVNEGPQGQLICGYPRHPAAALFQLLEGEQLTALADSIEANGQRDRIVLVTVGGKTSILDGSNRGIACEMRKIKPQFVHYEGPKDLDSLVTYSMDKNKHRRHQEPSVLAMVAVDAGLLLGRGNPGDRETGRSAGLMTQAQVGKKLGVSERLIRKAVVVRDRGTEKVKEAVRKGKLAVDAAEQVSRLPSAKQDEIADEALARTSQTRSGRVRSLVRQEEKRAVVRKINDGRVLPMPDGPFGVIYADYPWLFENSDQHEGSRGHMGYPPMTLEEIIAHARETRSRAAESCILALWTTNWHIVKQMSHVLDAYGAEHRTVITWPKEHAGVGTWPRGKTEHLVIASIGAPVHTLNELTTLLESYAQREHSRKPDEVADLLLKHCAGPHLELFGREQREGWAVWGAEPRKFASEAA